MTKQLSVRQKILKTISMIYIPFIRNMTTMATISHVCTLSLRNISVNRYYDRHNCICIITYLSGLFVLSPRVNSMHGNMILVKITQLIDMQLSNHFFSFFQRSEESGSVGLYQLDHIVSVRRDISCWIPWRSAESFLVYLSARAHLLQIITSAQSSQE